MWSDHPVFTLLQALHRAAAARGSCARTADMVDLQNQGLKLRPDPDLDRRRRPPGQVVPGPEARMGGQPPRGPALRQSGRADDPAVEELNRGRRPSLPRRLGRRLVISLATWPDAAGWRFSGAVGAATLAAVGAVGLCERPLRASPDQSDGLPLRLLTVLIAPALGEEAFFRGLLVPSRADAASPTLPDRPGDRGLRRVAPA